MFERVLAAMLLMAQLAEADEWNPNEGTMGIYSANQNISKWLNPNAFVGIFLTIVFFWIAWCVLGLMSQIQTPKIMLEKELDWGRVEKVDE